MGRDSNQISQGYAVFSSRHPQNGLSLIFAALTAYSRLDHRFRQQADVLGLSFASRSSTPTLADRGYRSAMSRRRCGKKDFNLLDYCAAWRFYCEYRTRERIHRGMADPRLLAIPTSRGRVSDLDLNWGRLFGISSALRLGNPLYRPL